MDFNSKKTKKISFWIIGIITTCILFFLCVQNINVVGKSIKWVINLISPLLIGCAIALILNVPMNFFESHLWKNTKKPFLIKIREPIAFLISLISILGILVGIILLVIPELIDAIKVIIQGIVDYINRINNLTSDEIAELPFGKLLLNINWDEIILNLQTWLKNQSISLFNTAFGTISSLLGGIFDMFISLVFAVYVLFSKDKLKVQIKRIIRAWFPKKFGEWTIHAVSVTKMNLNNFILGQSLEAVILGVLCMLGMFIFRFPYAPMVGALVGVTALLPVVGAFIGAGVGAFMIMTINPIKAIFFLIYIVILQQIEGNLIYPKVMGNRVNLPGMWILAAVTIGAGIAGPIGMLLSVPLASTFYVLFREATINKEKLSESKEVLEK